MDRILIIIRNGRLQTVASTLPIAIDTVNYDLPAPDRVISGDKPEMTDEKGMDLIKERAAAPDLFAELAILFNPNNQR